MVEVCHRHQMHTCRLGVFFRMTTHPDTLSMYLRAEVTNKARGEFTQYYAAFSNQQQSVVAEGKALIVTLNAATGKRGCPLHPFDQSDTPLSHCSGHASLAACHAIVVVLLLLLWRAWVRVYSNGLYSVCARTTANLGVGIPPAWLATIESHTSAGATVRRTAVPPQPPHTTCRNILLHITLPYHMPHIILLHITLPYHMPHATCHIPHTIHDAHHRTPSNARLWRGLSTTAALLSRTLKRLSRGAPVSLKR